MQAVIGHLWPPRAVLRKLRREIDDREPARLGERAHQRIDLVYARRLGGVGDMGREHQNAARILRQAAQQRAKIMVDLRERRRVEEKIVQAAIDDEAARAHHARLDDLRAYILQRRAAEAEAQHVEGAPAERAPVALRRETVADDGVARRPQTRDAPMQRDAKGAPHAGVGGRDQRAKEQQEKDENEKNLRQCRDHRPRRLARVIGRT